MHDPALSIRPARSPDPSYPGRSVPREFVRLRYGSDILDRMRSGLGRPFVILSLTTALALPARSDEEGGRAPVVRDGEAPADPVRNLSPAEVEGMIHGLQTAHTEQALAMPGSPAMISGYLTEEEGRVLLTRFLEKNGYSLDRDVVLRARGIDLVVDGFDRGRRVGFEFRGPTADCGGAFAHLEDDLDEVEVSSLELERARGGPAVLVLDAARYTYDKSLTSGGSMPTKQQAVGRLLEDVRRFVEWLRYQENSR